MIGHPKPPRTPPKAKKPLPKARKRIRARNPQRQKKNHERAYGVASGKMAWIKSQPCHFCGAMKNVEAAHAVTGGTGFKAGSETLIPMCGPGWKGGAISEGCHRSLHLLGVTTFLKSRGFANSLLTNIAAQYEAEFQSLASSSAQRPNTGDTNGNTR